MLDILKFIFSDLWHYIGTLILIYAIGANLSMVGQAFVRNYQPITYNLSKKEDEEETKDGVHKNNS